MSNLADILKMSKMNLSPAQLKAMENRKKAQMKSLNPTVSAELKNPSPAQLKAMANREKAKAAPSPAPAPAPAPTADPVAEMRAKKIAELAAPKVEDKSDSGLNGFSPEKFVPGFTFTGWNGVKYVVSEKGHGIPTKHGDTFNVKKVDGKNNILVRRVTRRQDFGASGKKDVEYIIIAPKATVASGKGTHGVGWETEPYATVKNEVVIAKIK